MHNPGEHPEMEQRTAEENAKLSPAKRLKNWVDGDHYEMEPAIDYKIPKSDTQRRKLTLMERVKKFRKGYVIASVVICIAFIGMLIMMTVQMPKFGEVDVPTNNEVAQKYIEDGLEDTGAMNIVAGMILDYRAFDTLGESTVLFIAVSAVIILLKKDPDHVNPEQEAETRREELLAKSRPNIILKIVASVIIPFILLFGAYVVLNGHLSPGGGFSGGAIMGAALILFASAFGFKKMDTFFNFKTFTGITSTALLVYACSKAYSFTTGANHWESYIPKGIPGAILSGGLILPLDICVGMIVASTMYAFYSLFSRGDL